MDKEAKLAHGGTPGDTPPSRTGPDRHSSPVGSNTFRQRNAAGIAERSRFFSLAVLLAFAWCSSRLQDAAADEALDTAFPMSSIVIESSGDACYRFDVYLALAAEQWRRGLMHVRRLDAMTGMLFVYPESAPRSMWMKNTFIPLDMLFIRDDGSIATIVADTEPQSLESIRSGEPVRFVLELNAGATARLGIEPGDVMLWEGAASPTSSEH